MAHARVTKKILKEIDWNVFNDLRRRLSAGEHAVRIGVPDSAVESDGSSVAKIAAVHEYGSPSQGIPERPFLGAAIRENAKRYVALNRQNLLAIFQGKMTVVQALGQLGELAKGDVQKKISYGSFTPLDPKTIAARQRARSSGYNSALRRKAAAEPETEQAKKHRARTGGVMDRPLIDSGQLIQSISWEIE